MSIHFGIEPLVREALAAAVARDPGRSATGLQAMVDAGDSTVTDSVNLGLAIDGYALLSLHQSQRPGDERLRSLAHSFVEMESWAEFEQEPVLLFLTAIADQRPVGQVIAPVTGLRLTFVLGGWLLSAFPPEDRRWSDFSTKLWTHWQMPRPGDSVNLGEQNAAGQR